MSDSADHEISVERPTSLSRAKKGHKHKRKRAKQSAEELYRIQSADRYKKLRHACSKHMHKEAKIVKSFECQKIVRAIKAASDSLSAQAPEENENNEEGRKRSKNASKASKRVQMLQQKLDQTKKMDLEVLVQVGLKRLGLLSLDPHLHEGDNKDGDEGWPTDNLKAAKSQRQTSATKTFPQSEDKFYQTLLETMFRHKRLSAALDQLNEKVTEYHQWTTHREAILRGEANQEENPPGSKKRKKKKQNVKTSTGNDTMIVAGGFDSRKRGLDLGGHEGASGLFIGSLSGMMPAEGYADGGENYMDGQDGYEEEGQYGYPEEKKKNRPGQRARRAKAMAIEARNAGKTWDSSINWREKKDHHGSKYDTQQRRSDVEGGDREGDNKSRGNKGKRAGGTNGQKEAQHIATMGKAWKEEGNAHPSWAAASQKSQGIAKFQGKKITFD